MTAVPFLARSIRGVEDLLADEIAELQLGPVGGTGHREVRFDARPTPAVIGLRTADDVFVVAATLTGIGHTKAALAQIADATSDVDAWRLLELRQACGTTAPDCPLCIDVSASFVGRRTYNRYDIEDAVGTELARQLGARYHPRRNGQRPPDGSISWRVTLDGPDGTIALRVTDRPLHRRGYKTSSIVGTLHPPLAAAMVRLSGAASGRSFLDPCCGVGTLPIEAYDIVPSLSVVGADLDAATLVDAYANGTGRAIGWLRSDAGRLPLADGTIGHVAVNPPWGRQVQPAGLLAAEPEAFWTELRRVLAADGRAVVLLHEPGTWLSVAERAGLATSSVYPVSLFGTHPVVAVLT